MKRLTITSGKTLASSYRFRTSIFLFCVVIIVGLVIGGTLRFGVRFALQHEIDLLLQEDAAELAQVLYSTSAQVSPELGLEWNRRASEHELHHWWLRVLDDQGTPIWESLSAPEPRPPIFQDSLEPLTWNDYQIIQRGLTIGSKYHLQIGTGLDTLEKDLWLLDRLLFIALATLAIAGPISAWVLAGRLLDPLADLTKAAEQLESATTGQLLPVRGSRDELDRLAETINNLLIRVGKEIQQREDWLANSAHQLRSPLAAISSNVEVVSNRLEDGPSKEMLDSVLHECGSLRTLVNKLLLLSEADADRVKQRHKPIDLEPIVRQSIEIFEGLAIAQEVALTTGKIEHCVVDGNQHYLRHVVQNVLDNAIKYSLKGGSVNLTLESSNGRCILKVVDQGIGISEDDLKKVTERFFRADSGRNPNSTPRGSGLGLSICQAIVEGHAGTLRIDSKLGSGTTVVIDFPLYTNSSTDS